MEHRRIGGGRSDEVSPAGGKPDGPLHNEEQPVDHCVGVDEETGIQEHVRVEIALQDPERSADNLLLVRSGEIVWKAEPQTPQAQRPGKQQNHTEHCDSVPIRSRCSSIVGPVPPA